MTTRPPIHQVWPPPESNGSTGSTGPPDPADPAAVIRAACAVERPRPADRPWVALTMISSIDGRTHVGGNSKGLGNANDSAVLLTMREVCDVVLVGSTTVVADRYGPPSKPGQRIAVVTRSCDLDVTTPLFTSGSGFLVTTNEAPVPQPDHRVDVVRSGDGEIDFAAALRGIDRLVGGADTVHLEGGPTLNGLMFDAGLIDEINLTTSPMVVGGSSSPVIDHAGAEFTRFTLAHQLIDDEGYVFSRWVRDH